MNVAAFVRGYLKREYGATPEQIEAFLAYQRNIPPSDAYDLTTMLEHDASVYFGVAW